MMANEYELRPLGRTGELYISETDERGIHFDPPSIAFEVGPGQSTRPQRKWTTLRLALFVYLLITIIIITSALVVPLTLRSEGAQSTQCFAVTYMFDCYPEGGVTETSILCQSRGCCWNSSASPSCFYPDGFSYAMNGALSEESYGHSAALSRKANQPVQYRGPAATLRVDVFLETQYRLRVKVGIHVYVLSSPWALFDLTMFVIESAA